MNKLILLPAIGTALSLLNVNAAIIFDASTTNSGIVDNNFSTGPTNTFSGTTGALTVTTVTAGNNHMSGLASNDDIDTLKGSALLATDTVTMKLTIASSTLNNIRANGLEFGMSPAAPAGSPDTDVSDFRPANNLLFQIDADNDSSGMAIGNLTSGDNSLLNAAGWAVTEASLGDGFTVTLVADSAGYNFTLTDIQEFGNLANTTLSFGGAFTGTEFIDNFGGGHIYYARQIATGTAEVNISELSIDVVPEPSTTAFLGLLTLGCVFNRRRAS